MKNYSYEEIFRMLLPKLKKHYPDIEHRIVNDDVDWAFLLSLCYKSGYIRGQLGRSFIIGEKKAKEPVNIFKEKVTEHWVPATKDNVKVGSKVRYLNAEKHEQNPEFYPARGAVGEVISVSDDGTCLIQWLGYVTSWFSNQSDLEVLLCE